jgi:hypothetical protein
VTAKQPLPIDSAADALLTKIQQRGWSVNDLTAPRAWQAFLDFATVPFDIPDQPDADGLLYQFGVYDFSGEPAFHLDPVRQLAVHDEDEYVQVHLEMRFAVDPALVAHGTHDEWWFSDGDTPLSDWAAAISRRPEWATLSSLKPTSIKIYQDET